MKRLTPQGRRQLLRRDDPEPSPAELRYESAVDEAIAAAQARGEFDHLPGTGQPLELGEQWALLDPQWLVHHLLKNAGYDPPWAAAGRAVAVAQAASQRAVAVWRQAPPQGRGAAAAAVTAAWEAENAAVRQWNRLVPHPSLQRYPTPVARRWRQLTEGETAAP